MLKIILIRPGSTDYDVQHRIQGALDIPLNDQGAAEAEQMVRELADLQIEVIYAPDSQPAEQTARILSQGLKIKSRRLDRMQNLDQGLWQGMRVDDVRQKQPRVYRQWQEQPESVCPPEGEMLGDADERVRSTIARLLKKHRDGVIALVLPEPLLSLVRRLLSHEHLGDLWKASFEPSHWQVFEVRPEIIFATS